jgi:hypothetical protein
MDIDPFARQQGVQRRLYAVDIDTDCDVDHCEQLIVLAIQREVRGAQTFAEHIERSVGERHDIDDVGVAGGNLADCRIDPHDARFVQGQQQAGRALHGAFGGDGDHRLLCPNRH